MKKIIATLAVGAMTFTASAGTWFNASLTPDIAVETRELARVGPDGSDVWSAPRGLAAGYRWPQYSVHRGELEMLLYRTTVDRLGSDAVTTGHRVTGYDHGLDVVHVELTAPDGTVERRRMPPACSLRGKS